MRIQCPDCRSIYAVPDSRLDGRKSVRCARCGQSFAPTPMPQDVAPAAEPPPTLPLPAPPPAPPPPAPTSMPILMPLPVLTRLSRAAEPEPTAEQTAAAAPWLRLAWIGSLGSVTLVLVLLVLAHGAIADAWPPMRRLYGAIGLN